MKIWIDADACPRIIKEIVFRASERLHLPVCLVANMDLSKAHSPLVTSVRVAEGFDAADDYIVQHAAPEDLVVTADIPLAARLVAQGGVAQLGLVDRQRFASALDRTLTRMVRGRR